tara:strand:- start:1256 stop:3586 length:2331 start_codon:yes stop_codon:yes gene_type:complete
LSGFGEKKIEKKVASKRLKRLSENELKNISIQNHIKGKIKEAENGYIAYINNGYSDPDIYSNYALICEKNGETDKAIKLYQKCTQDFPIHVYSKLNLAFLYYTLNDLNKAESQVNEAIKLKPELANCYCIKGLIKKKDYKFNESKILFKKALGIDPKFFDAIINLALLMKEENNYTEAKKYYLKALEIDNNSAIAHLNIGVLYKEIHDMEKAIYHTEQAINLDKKINNAYLNLATIYCDKGEYEKSFLLAKKELSINNENELTFNLIAEIFKNIEIENSLDKRFFLKKLFERKDISHREIFKNISNLVPNDILYKLSIMKDKFSESKDFNYLINDNEIVKALTLIIFSSPLWEKTFINIRKNILFNYTENQSLNKKLIKFLIGLATQCFLNEYVYYTSIKEKKALDKIKRLLDNKKNFEFKIALIACYEPLFLIKEENLFYQNYNFKNEDLNELINLQIDNRKKEKEISKGIRKISLISNIISKKVKHQYEINPYPRWRYNSYTNENKITIISAINSEIYPNRINSIENNIVDKEVDILIAGCGTGIQILEASRYSNCKITAIDLSNSSISYAKRKSEEYGMKNINFIEMDILDLNKLNKKFELIECSGVLHHMKDPIEGLCTLSKFLEPNGFLKLGLYSKYAREEVIKVRKLIKERNIESSLEGIRLFRNTLLNNEKNDFHGIISCADFYSTSMCRDLCFHSNEIYYSLFQIKDILDKANLEFLGFTLDQNIKNIYSTMNKQDEYLIDLQLWDKFEKSNKNIFREMYQFWVRKVN